MIAPDPSSPVNDAVATFLAYLEGEAAPPSLDDLTEAEREEAECAIQIIEDARGVDPKPYLESLRRSVTVVDMARRTVGTRGRGAAAPDRPRRRPARRRLPKPPLSKIAAALVAVILAVATLFSADEEAVAAVAFTPACGGADDQGIVVAGVWSDDERARFAPVLELFEKWSGSEVTLAYQPEGHDIADTLRARVERHCPPDIALVPQPGLVAELASKGNILPIEDIAGDLVTKHYSPEWRRLGSVKDTLYGVWFKAANKSIVWYSTEAFREVGVHPPQTWEEWQRVAGDIATKSELAPFALAGDSGWTLTDWFENVYLRTAGPEKYDRLADHRLLWTDDSVKDTLRVLAEIFAKKEWLPDGPEGALRTDYAASVRQVFGSDRKAAMVFEGDFVSNHISKQVRPLASFFEFPRVGHDSEAGLVAGGDVAVLFTDNELSKKLIRFLATPEAAEPWAREGGFSSPNKSLDPGVYPDDATRRAARLLVDAKTIRFDLSDLQQPTFGSARDQGMGRALQDFLREPNRVDATAQRLEAEWQQNGRVGAVTVAPKEDSQRRSQKRGAG